MARDKNIDIGINVDADTNFVYGGYSLGPTLGSDEASLWQSSSKYSDSTGQRN